jgi:hypothetical protein
VTEQTPPKRRTWIWIVAGVVVLFAFVAIGGVIVAVSFFRQNVNVTQIAEDAASRQFEEVRNRFPGQQPLIQIVDGTPQFVSSRASQSATPAPLKTLHVIAFDRDEGNLVTFSLPFWLLRMKSGPIRLSTYQPGWDDRGVSFRIEDIEKHGPGVIVDANHPGEGRVIVWAE